MKWAWGWNQPGCLPEGEVAEADSWAEAMHGLAEDIRRHGDEAAEADGEARWAGQPSESDLVQVADALDAAVKKGAEQSVTSLIGGWVYWVQPAE